MSWRIKGAKEGFFFCGGTPECADVMFFQLFMYFSAHHFADAGFDEVVQQLLCRKMCSHVRCSIVLKIQTRSKGNWFKTCAPGEQETSQTCQQRALRSQATERGVTIAHTEPSFRGEVAPQFSPMQDKSEVSSGILELHRVERMRHTNQVGVKSTWSSPESTRSARWNVHSRGPRPACGSGFLWRRSASTSGGVCNSPSDECRGEEE